GRDGDPHAPGGRTQAAAYPRLGVLEVRDELRGRFQEVTACVRQPDVARGPNEQLSPQARLEGCDLLAHRGLPDPELARDGREASALDDTDEHLDRIEAVHGSTASGRSYAGPRVFLAADPIEEQIVELLALPALERRVAHDAEANAEAPLGVVAVE